MSRIAVLDACVLIPSALRDTLLRAAELDMYVVRWSEEILAEVTRNLVNQAMTTPVLAAHLRQMMERAFDDAVVPEASYSPLVATMTNHPKDRHVLAAAVACGAEVIVTFNVRDFPERALVPYGVESQLPDDFLESLYNREPELMIQMVTEQAADLRHPPLSAEDVAWALSRHAPRFAARLLLALGLKQGESA